MIEVFNRKDIPDVFGQDVRKNIGEMGISVVEEVFTSEIYRFQCSSGRDELRRIAENILVDAVIQEYLLDEEMKAGERGEFMVEVFYKSGVTDSVADTVRTAVRDAGIRTKMEVSTGRRYYLRGNLTGKDVETICRKILVNPLIQNYSVIEGKGNHPDA